jgi:hypothetical protein
MPQITTTRGATGAAIFKSGSTELFWIGPRSGLFLLFGDKLVRIEHRSADGEFETLAEARKAAAAFMAVDPERAAAWEAHQSWVREANAEARERREMSEGAE